MFIAELLTGIVIGMVLAVPPGPIGVTTIKLAMFQGRESGIRLAYGNWLMDTIYCLMATFTTSAAVSTLGSINLRHPFIVLLIQLAIVAAFIILGFINLRKSRLAKNSVENGEAEPAGNNRLNYLKTKGPFFLGIAIALTNMANPTFLPALAAVALQVQSMHLIQNSWLGNLLFSVGFGFGNFLWLYLIIRLVVKYKHKMSENFVVRIKQFSGIMFISFGTLLGYRVIAVTPWSELVRLAMLF